MGDHRRGQRIAAAGALVLMLFAPATAPAEELLVPINLQAQLLFLVAGHDRTLPARAGGRVRTLVLTKAASDSVRCAAQFKAVALAKTSVAGLPHSVEVMPFAGAASLAKTCSSRRIAIVYLTIGFTGEEAATIGDALEGSSVLTVTAAPRLVKKGAVLGFDLVSGRAKLLVDLDRAAKQRVAFDADVLGLMTVSR